MNEDEILSFDEFVPAEYQTKIINSYVNSASSVFSRLYSTSNNPQFSFTSTGTFGNNVPSDDDVFPVFISNEAAARAEGNDRAWLDYVLSGRDPRTGGQIRNFKYEYDAVRAGYVRLDLRLHTLEGGTTLLDKLIRLYTTYMAQDVRSPIPHLVGPPGVGKSASVEQLARLTEKRLHVVNVSRINVLELEGVQMPVGNHENGDYRLHLLTSTLWSQLKEGDIVLLDEFLRGFPEVYNGLLDIMTSRQVAGFDLPKVFFIGASNSVATYDKALDDRLLHIPVVDVRSNKRARADLKELIVSELGLLPDAATFAEMEALVTQEIDPTYEMLDPFLKWSGVQVGATATVQGQSARKLIGQAKLREVQSKALAELISMNNLQAMQQNKAQYVLLMSGHKSLPPQYRTEAARLVGNPRLTEVQRVNLDLNLQLIEMEEATKESKKEDTADEAE